MGLFHPANSVHCCDNVVMMIQTLIIFILFCILKSLTILTFRMKQLMKINFLPSSKANSRNFSQSKITIKVIPLMMIDQKHVGVLQWMSCLGRHFVKFSHQRSFSPSPSTACTSVSLWSTCTKTRAGAPAAGWHVYSPLSSSWMSSMTRVLRWRPRVSRVRNFTSLVSPPSNLRI